MFKRRFVIKKRPVKKNCIFCKDKIEPDYKETDKLKSYISDSCRILGKDATGLCAKHQRRIAIEIKRGRDIALLPFVASFK